MPVGRFSVDGCKMPSNASKEWSGTKAELKKKKEEMEKVVRQIIKRHRETDATEVNREEVHQKHIRRR